MLAFVGHHEVQRCIIRPFLPLFYEINQFHKTSLTKYVFFFLPSTLTEPCLLVSLHLYGESEVGQLHRGPLLLGGQQQVLRLYVRKKKYEIIKNIPLRSIWEIR